MPRMFFLIYIHTLAKMSYIFFIIFLSYVSKENSHRLCEITHRLYKYLCFKLYIFFKFFNYNCVHWYFCFLLIKSLSKFIPQIFLVLPMFAILLQVTPNTIIYKVKSYHQLLKPRFQDSRWLKDFFVGAKQNIPMGIVIIRTDQVWLQ